MNEKKSATAWAGYPQAMASAIETRGEIAALGESLAARAALLAAAHDAQVALKAFEDVMAEHEDADIGEGLARPLIAIRARLEGTADFMAGRLPPVDRTPEVVLRAMLRAYEARAEAAHVADIRATCPALRHARNRAQRANDVLHAMLYWHMAGKDLEWDDPTLSADYEARLRGDRPLDAPPPEVP